MTPQRFVSELGALRFENTFNPYSESCPVCDADGAPRKRSDLLIAILEAALLSDLDAIWIGRDLGYRGGRRTGLAFTDDVHLAHHQARWGIDASRPTKGSLVAERTAGVVWDLLDGIDRPTFLWNVFPLHPHEAGNPFSNRSHTAAERRAGSELLEKLIALLRPRRLIAVGNDAEKAIRQYSTGVEVIKVRHPSFGGQTEFTREITRLYGARPGSLL